MPWRTSCIFLALLCLNGFIFASGQESLPTFARGNWNTHNRNANSNIKFDEPVDSAAGSGDGNLVFVDDEDLGESGSGSGSGAGAVDLEPHGPVDKVTVRTTTTTTMPTTTTTTSRPLTPCENMRQASQHVVGRFVPQCLPNGDFASLQCHGHPGTADCWCSDLEGREIPGTLMEAPNFPLCDEGYNLPPCVYQLVKHARMRLLGTYRPKCAVDGQFARKQCHGSMCFCVDEESGAKIPSSEVHIPDEPNCDEEPIEAPEITTKTVVPLNKNNDNKPEQIDIDEEAKEPEYVFPEDTIDLDPVTPETDKETDKDMGIKFEDDNKSDTGGEEEIAKPGSDGQHTDKMEKASEIMTQPGILAGIIGGSVVLLLCLVLLVMFIIYRMRKKDEGSYPLDEPRKTPNYNYVRAPEKEFYA